MENMLGVLGGMGPLATQLFYKMIIDRTDAERDQDHINMMILSHATMPDRTAALKAGNAEEVADLLYEDCRTLQNAGCRAVCIPCNTSHCLLPLFEGKLQIPVINMVEESAMEMAKIYKGQKVAILATDGTIGFGLYQNAFRKYGIEPYVPSEKGQKMVMYLIYDCVKAGQPVNRKIVDQLREELVTAGCSGGLLACTELSVIKANGYMNDFFSDAMEIMALRAIEFMGKKIR